MEFEQAIKRPFLDFKKWIIGCALMIVPIVNFFAVGYNLEAAKLTLKKKNNLPEWDNWGTLFIEGLLSGIISLIYFIPAIFFAIIGGISVFAQFFTSGIGRQMGQMEMMRSFFSSLIGPALGFFILAFILGLIALYVSPAAIFNYLSTNKFGDGFNFSLILKKVMNGKYFTAFLVGLVVYILLQAILGWIWIIGPAVAGFTSMMIMYTLLAEAYRG